MSRHATELRERALTGMLGLSVTPAALVGVPLVILAVAIAAQPPDELQPDGDPCCPVPDSWAEVMRYSVVAVFAAGLDLAALTLGGALLWFTVLYRWPHPRIIWVPIIATGGVALLLVGLLIARAS